MANLIGPIWQEGPSLPSLWKGQLLSAAALLLQLPASGLNLLLVMLKVRRRFLSEQKLGVIIFTHLRRTPAKETVMFQVIPGMHSLRDQLKPLFPSGELQAS